VGEELVLEVLVDPFLDDDVVVVALLNRSANDQEIRGEEPYHIPFPGELVGHQGLWHQMFAMDLGALSVTAMR
jgi:hypothetical protein